MLQHLSEFVMMLIGIIMMMVVIKMIIPEGKNKKYLLFVCGVITTIVMIDPLLELMNLGVNEILAKNQIEYEEVKVDENLYQKEVQNSYHETMVQDVIQRLNENGYRVSNVRIEYDTSGYTPQRIYLHIEDNEGYVQPIKIEVASQNAITKVNDITKNEIQRILQVYYGVEKNQIFFE